MSLKNDEKESCSDSRISDPAERIPDFNIDDSTREALCFRENLIASLKEEDVVSSSSLSSSGKQVGGYCISIESVGPKGNEFMIQIISSLSVNDSYAGSKVTASSTGRLRCLEEKRTEFINRCDGYYEKKLYVGLEDDFYHLETEESCPCDKTENKIDIPLRCNENIIGEGVNVLLIRYLALINFHGSLSLQGLTIDGKITISNYRCYEYRLTKFNNKNIQVYTVERRIHEQCGLVHNSITHLTTKGRILRHDWLEIPYLLKINPLVDPEKIYTDHCLRIHSPLESRLDSDVQLMSQYLDKKTCQMAQQTEYLEDHPEIKKLISDFAQSLLSVKPKNVLSYAIQHFASFAKNPEESFPGFGKSNLGIILSQIAKRKEKAVCKFCGVCSENYHPKEGECRCEISRSESEASSCSVFENCDNEAPCNLNFRRKTNTPASSSCSILSKCPSDANCVRKLSNCEESLSDCNENCEGCKTKKINKESRSVCAIDYDCENTCEGCKTKKINKESRSVCAIDYDCENTCEGCKTKKFNKKSRSVCAIDYDCENTCEGCLESCQILKDCPECPGCRNYCDDHRAEFCPDCRGCE